MYERDVTTGDTATWYSFAGDSVAFRTGGALKFAVGDYQGSTSTVYTPSTGDIARQRYYPFGDLRDQVGTVDTDIGYTGQRRDDATGLMFYQARYYDPVTARFAQPDTIVPDPANPQDLNRYSYVRNNPVSFTDPTGHRLMEGSSYQNAGSAKTKGGVTYSSASNADRRASTRYVARTTYANGGSYRPAPSRVRRTRDAHPGGDLGRGRIMANADSPGMLSEAGLGVSHQWNATADRFLAEGSGVADGGRCIGDRDRGSCAWFVAGLIPLAKLGKLTKPLSRVFRRGGRTSRTALVEAGKYDYIFGNVTSNAHNAARSAQNAQQLGRIGIHDNSTGRALIQDHFNDVVASSENVLRSYSNSHGSFKVRESLLAGPGGFLKLESTWHVTDSGQRLTSVIPLGR